ncbi:MAG: hypothetical protein EXR74_03590 [Bdellovibrionales bacterium]|nr:hypothetical protein [Bdellovibrionales bacterium]
MKCVRCHSSLTPQFYESIEIDRCAKCSGAWLDAGELGKIVATPLEKFSKALIAKTLESRKPGIPDAEIKSEEKCPKCSAAMVAKNYAYGSGVIIDSCPQGHGIWLDANELDKIQAFKEHGDEELEENREKWHAIASDARVKAEGELKELDTFLPRIAVFVKDWLKIDD